MSNISTKGIVLAGGSGTRLHPSTLVISKQLLPVYDKPMIYYPLSVLMLAGIKEILIISTPSDLPLFEKLLGNGSQFGIKISYKVQPSPSGLAEAFILGEEFIGTNSVAMVLGDNIFYGANFTPALKKCSSKQGKASVFAYEVKDPHRYGIVEFDKDQNIVSLEEKPQNPKSNFAITGLYFYPNNVIAKAKSLKPSKRGELEITDLNRLYLADNNLEVEFLSRGFAWLDTGTHKSLLQASNYVSVIEENQGVKIACLEEIAYKLGYLTKDQILANTKDLKGDYYDYIRHVIEA